MTKFRSQFELSLSKLLSKIGTYEGRQVKYTIPESYHTYTPDWVIETNKGEVWVEAKGKLDIQAQKKMKFIRQQYPEQRIVFIFQNSQNKIRKGSKTTYKDWAIKNGFEVVEPIQLHKDLLGILK